MRISALTVALTALLLITSTSSTAKLYRWVDADGNVHYSDKIPPSQVELAREQLNERGVHIGTTTRAKTAEEVAREQELERLRAERQRLIEKQNAADRVLLRTFRSEDDLIMARKGKIQSIDVMIKVAQSNIRRHQAKLTDLQRRAASLERTGRLVPKQLVSSIDTTLANINQGYSTIDRKEREKSSIREVYDRDLKRFRELRPPSPSEELATMHTVQKLDNLVHCADQAACSEAWKRAETYVRRYATTRMQMLGDNIIMTAAPHETKDISITVSRIENRENGTTVLFMDLFCKETTTGKELCASDKVQKIRAAYQREVGGSGQRGSSVVKHNSTDQNLIPGR